VSRSRLRRSRRCDPEFVGAPQLGLGIDIDALVAGFGAKSPIGVSPERIFTK